MLNIFTILRSNQLNEQSISKRLISIYNKNQYIDFILDSTVDKDFLKDFINMSSLEIESEKLFLAKPVSRQDKEQIVFVRIKSLNVLLKVIDEIVEQILDQTSYETTRFIVLGWGQYDGDLHTLKINFSKTIIGTNTTTNRKFIFRWYDPRVQYFCAKIFPEVFATFFLGKLKDWEFIHPQGLFKKNEISHNYKFNYTYPDELIDFFSKIEDVNIINKYMSERHIEHSLIEPTKTHQLLSLLLNEKPDISFEDINELIYWFYKIDKDLVKHPYFNIAWTENDYNQIYKILNSLTEIQMQKLKSELNYGG